MTTIHVHLSEIETTLVQALEEGVDRIITVAEQQALVNRLQLMYEVVIALDFMAGEAVRHIHDHRPDLGIAKLFELHGVVQGFLVDAAPSHDDPSGTDEPDKESSGSETAGDVQSNVVPFNLTARSRPSHNPVEL